MNQRRRFKELTIAELQLLFNKRAEQINVPSQTTDMGHKLGSLYDVMLEIQARCLESPVLPLRAVDQLDRNEVLRQRELKKLYKEDEQCPPSST